MERRVRLPKFQPANPVLFRSSINVAVPPGPSHLEVQGDFTEAMSNMAGIPHSVTLSLAHALWNEMASLQLLFPILTMFEDSKASNIPLPPNMKYEQILRNALMTIIDELGRVFERTERRAQFRRLEIVVAPSSALNPDEVEDVEKRFLCAYTTFAPNREFQAPELSNAVLIIDSAPEPLGDIGPETQVVRCPPFALTALAEKVFNRFGHRSHVFGMTSTTPPQPLEEIEGAVQLISFLATLCLMDDSQRGFGTSFFTSSSLLTDLRHFDQLSVPSQTRDHSFAIAEAVVVPQTLYGMGSCVYSARKVTNDTQNLPITDEGDTYTLKVGSHTRPWESTKHLYARAEAAGVKQLAKIEEALFGDLIGDGFRWHAGLDESSYSDLRPRMLAIPGTWIPIWSCGTTWGINNAFKQLIKGIFRRF
ncbi:hypothetical protein DL93DRAFT_2077817 [Clavulina sp. PMI_390]|nr:hypothetical protein DL93DRAFT_2077817 [Clavulina sp. PMI_390]